MIPRLVQRVSLLALVAAAFVVQPMLARATAGVWVEEVACCCPDPDTCPCHDHDERGSAPDPQLRKCGQRGTLVEPVVLLAITPVAPPSPIVEPRVRDMSPIQVERPPAERPIRPVTPPF